MKQPKVSIMIPSFNRAHLLPRAIKSCQMQTHKNVEVVVYDDGSTDGTEDVVKRIARRDGRVVYHKGKANVGEIPSRTCLMGLATGEYGCWLDSDDLCNCWRVEMQLWVMFHKETRMYSFVRTAHTRRCKLNADTWMKAPMPAWKYDRVTATKMFRMDVGRRTKYDHSVLNGGDIIHELQMTLDAGSGIVLPFECYLQDTKQPDRMSLWVGNKHKARHAAVVADLRAHEKPLLKALAAKGVDPYPPVLPNHVTRELFNRLYGMKMPLF